MTATDLGGAGGVGDAGPGAEAAGRIGPNAITQFLPGLDRLGGAGLRAGILARAGIAKLPDMTGLVDEREVARLHRAVREALPDQAEALCREAGRRTADYILAHRIPGPARATLRWLPAPVAAPILAKAIARNAWTFAGSGRFAVARWAPPVFVLEDNPLIAGERAPAPICHWHAAVFERLFQVLAGPRARVRETACRAAGADACRFEVTG